MHAMRSLEPVARAARLLACGRRTTAGGACCTAAGVPAATARRTHAPRATLGSALRPFNSSHIRLVPSLTNLPALSHACDQLLPCALPLHRRGRTPDPVERAARALQCAPAGWLVLECRVSPYERWARDEARRRAEAEAAEQAAATAAVQAAAEVAAEATRVASEREHLDATRAMTEDIERLRVEIMANADKKGMLD